MRVLIFPLIALLFRTSQSKLIAGETMNHEEKTITDVESIHWSNNKLNIKMKNGTVLLATLRPMASLLAKNFEVDEVEDAGDKHAMQSSDANEMLGGCDFEGELDIDPDSRITMTTCSHDFILMTIVSDVYPFQIPTYRFRQYKATSRRNRRSPKEKDDSDIKHEEEDDQSSKNASGVDYSHAEENALLGGPESLAYVLNRTNEFLDHIHNKKSGQLKKWSSTLESEEKLMTPEDFQIDKEKKTGEINYKENTIELAVITDPFLYNRVQDIFFDGKGKEEDVIKKIYSLVHEVMVSAQAFLLHPTISKEGGFRIQLNGLQILKEWGHFQKMSKRKLLLSILHDLANYLKVINHNWDGHYHSYDGVLYLTGQEDYTDGDGYSYIGHVCLVDCPIVSKFMMADDHVHPNMGRLIAHEIGHLLGADHDEETETCEPGKFIMTKMVNTSMHAWSDCSRKSIEEIVTERTEEFNCFKI